jgi:hypothetical protein
MENHKKDSEAKTTDNEHYDPENPQKQNVPAFNSTSTHRDGASLPAVENLNEIKDEKDQLKDAGGHDSDDSAPKNDESLYGKATQTDLGQGQRDEDEDEDEKIIRT